MPFNFKDTKVTAPERSEKIIAAEHVQRPNTSLTTGNKFQPLVAKSYNHHGVNVTTESKRQFLVHNDKSKGVVYTDAKNMSKNWVKSHDIEIKKDTTLQKVMNVPSSASHPKLAVFFF
ncbi:hypothetical protein Bhyg_07039 [Pseudolycoriella hygida]|uniref:Uncharacterized protein n=1 Tax=Pseudolycoriella hygida TaxID=35572 RepID=A0A9Q0N1U0_9DIPT|nr:hypothetical protein Bhyg_07039 [Pseudolycoriella hygida]